MKKIFSIFILLFLLFILIVFNSNINCIEQTTENEKQPIIYSKITYETIPKKISEVHIDPYEAATHEMQEKMLAIESIQDTKEWYLAYKDIICEYADYFGFPITIFDVFSEYDVDLICRVVETETYQCDFNSKVNVANVVINRIESGKFGDTVEEVVTKKNQFAYGRKNITEDTILAVMYAYEQIDTTGGALFFHSNEKTDTFCGNEFIFQDEAGHNFY